MIPNNFLAAYEISGREEEGGADIREETSVWKMFLCHSDSVCVTAIWASWPDFSQLNDKYDKWYEILKSVFYYQK